MLHGALLCGCGRGESNDGGKGGIRLIIRDIAFCYSLLLLVKYALFSSNQADGFGCVSRFVRTSCCGGQNNHVDLILWFFFPYVYDLLPTTIIVEIGVLSESVVV